MVVQEQPEEWAPSTVSGGDSLQRKTRAIVSSLSHSLDPGTELEKLGWVFDPLHLAIHKRT